MNKEVWVFFFSFFRISLIQQKQCKQQDLRGKEEDARNFPSEVWSIIFVNFSSQVKVLWYKRDVL
jgi:hypothetical protein